MTDSGNATDHHYAASCGEFTPKRSKTKKGGKAPPFFCLVWGTLEILVHGYFDSSRFGFFGFRNVYFQYAVLVRRLDPVVLYGFRQGE